MGANTTKKFDDYHRAALKRLEVSGADFALIASNTPHLRLAPIVRGIGIPVISILEVLAKESARIGVRQVLILGTDLTMRSARFREEFAKQKTLATFEYDGVLYIKSTAAHLDAAFEFWSATFSDGF